MDSETMDQTNESNDSVEFMKLFDDIDNSTGQIKESISNLKRKIQSGEMSTAKGLSILEVKNHMLLNYMANIAYLIIGKCSGKSIEGDPAIERLVEMRTVLERIRPLEQKLKYQIDKLMKTAVTGSVDQNDPSQFRANPANMSADVAGSDDSDSDEDRGRSDKNNSEMDEKRKAGIYVPPRLAAVHYDGDESKSAKQEKLLERARKHALNSSVLQELREEYLDVPTEVGQASTFKAKQSARQRERQEYEETYFTRLPTTLKEQHKSRSLTTEGNLGSELTHFEDISVLEQSSERTFSGKKKTGKRKGKSSSKKGSKSKKRRFR